ncbi:MAG: LysR family transcriptional regulator [Lachnospiraceae bacterium]|nr:LysR family transcriptional regulator [Lachnospiraceae bacterium]
MTIRHLKIFITVAECGSMNTAAKELFLSQPTISQAIRELEEYYGTRLFDRLSRRLYITPAGQELLNHAYPVVAQFNQLEQNMKKGNQKEIIRIGSTITVGSCLISNVLNDFDRLIPETETYTFIGNTHMIEEKLLKSELDIALVEGEIHHPDLVMVPGIRDFLVLGCAANHPFAERDAVHVRELEGQKFVMREQGSGTRALFDRFIKRHSLSIRTSWEATCPDAFRNAILYNQCLAVVSVRLLERDIRSGQIRIFNPHTNELERCFSLVYHKDKVFTPAMNAVRDIIAHYRQPDWLDNVPVGTLTE